MATTIADVRRIAPELTAVSDADVTAFIADATLEVSPDTLMGRYDLAVRYLAAHKAKLAFLRGASGTAQTVTVGGITRTSATLMHQAGEYGATPYGIEFFRIISGTAACRLSVSA